MYENSGFHFGEIIGYPSVIGLVANLIYNKHSVMVIFENLDTLPLGFVE